MSNAVTTGNKVFGIGLSRTGTKSLAAALNLLGIKTTWYPHDEETYHQLLTADYRLSILEVYDGITDTPVVPFYPQLDVRYPNSKFVLTVRDKPSWLKSCESHWSRARPPGPNAEFAERFACFIDCCVYGCYAYNRDRFCYVYDRHVSEVMEYFRERPYDLLILDICRGEGWAKLCQFLNLEIPDVPFPHVTSGRSDHLK